jgi:hypothetical protein
VSGQKQWESFYGNSVCASGRFINTTVDGGFIITGDLRPRCDTQGLALLYKLDSSGTILWQKSFGAGLDNEGNFVTETMDGQILVLGRTVSYPGYGAGWSDCYLFKTGSSGNAVSGINNLRADFPVQVYPNPSQGQLNIKTGPMPDNAYIEIADVQGQIVFRQKLSGENTTANIQMLEAGTYCYSILNAGQKVSEGKFILMR